MRIWPWTYLSSGFTYVCTYLYVYMCVYVRISMYVCIIIYLVFYIVSMYVRTYVVNTDNAQLCTYVCMSLPECIE